MATSNVVISEGQVTFKRTGGHNHDGLTSTLIDTSKYSIFDFVVAENALDSGRRKSQGNRKEMLKSFIISTVEERVLKPTGILIQANTISAREIISGTITANELSSNIVLVDNVIRSKNYINNTTTFTGWAIYSNGEANFNNVNIRGNLKTGNGFYGAANTPLYADNIGQFSLGNKFIWNTTANSLTINAGNLTLGSNLSWDGNTLTISGNVSLIGNTNLGTFDNGDSLTGGSIGGITIGPSSIKSTDYDANPTTAGFAIFSDGTAVFNEMVVRGTVYAGAGSIGGWAIDSNGLSKTINIGGTNFTSSLAPASGLFLYGTVDDEYAEGYIYPGRMRVLDHIGSTTIAGGRIDASEAFVTNFYGNLTGDVEGHVFDTSGGIKFPYVRTTRGNMPTGHYRLNFQFNNPDNMYVMADDNNNSVHTWTTSTVSDRRTKSNISLNISDFLEKFYSLSMYEFEYNENRPWAGSSYIPTGEKEIGLIADEVEQLFPKAVIGDAEVSYQQVNYQEFCKILIGASLDQNKRIKELEARIQTLEGV